MLMMMERGKIETQYKYRKQLVELHYLYLIQTTFKHLKVLKTKKNTKISSDGGEI